MQRKRHFKASLKTQCKVVLRMFHQGWCNSRSYVNETLQRLEIVLVSDPFTKDSEHAAQPKFSKFQPRIFPGKSIEKIRQSA